MTPPPGTLERAPLPVAPRPAASPGRGGDLALCVLLALGAGIASYVGSGLLDPVLCDRGAFDVWFDADIPRVYENMLERLGNHSRTSLHPLFSLMAYPPTRFLHDVLGLGRHEAVRATVAMVALLWAGALFTLLRLLGCRRLDAVLFTALGAVSAAAVFGFVIPETFSFGSVTILLALVFLARSAGRRFGRWWDVALGVLTASATVTNWMAGLLIAFFRHRPRAFVRITLDVALIMGVLWSIQKAIFPSAEFIVSRRAATVVDHILRPEAGGVLHILQAFFCHSMVMPAFHLDDIQMWRPFFLGWQRMTVQLSGAGSATPWGMIAVVLWLGLLVLGVGSLLLDRRRRRFRLVFGLLVIGQIGLHLLFGYETFLFSLHYAPLLLVLAAWATLSRVQVAARLLAGALLVTCAINNALVFRQARAYVSANVTPRHEARLAALARPADPWPRGEGHVVVAWPGSEREEKGYLEPGGSFSPGPGSFGISIWQLDPQGRIVTTSDTVPLDEVTQSVVWPGEEGGPGVTTETPVYRALWTVAGPGRFRLSLDWPHGARTRAAIMVRSVGPAGGEIRSVDWNGKRLLVDERWRVTLSPAPAKVVLGEESQTGWSWRKDGLGRLESGSGWACARIEVATNRTELEVMDSDVTDDDESVPLAVTPLLRLDLPDRTFVECLRAQAAHLLMGLVGRETRPADPTDYLRPSTRDGAYIIVALARAGLLDRARDLAARMARDDFTGPFGPEADQPGHALWALGEVADELRDPTFESWLWPHVRRKAVWIERMLDTDGPIRLPVPEDAMAQMVGALVARQADPVTVAEASREGLIVGRVSWEDHPLFCNAIAYRGLIAAASLAERVNHAQEAGHWRERAEKLRAAWEKAARRESTQDSWGYSNLFWPSLVAVPGDEAIQSGLEGEWERLETRMKATDLWHQPDRLDLAEAHQWLLLGRADRVWRVLYWFWDHPISPGLFTWRSGGGTRVMRGAWPQVRGYVETRGSTPCYWAAAEMLLVQLDMLARVVQEPAVARAGGAAVSGTSDTPVSAGTVGGGARALVIGSGIPPAWLGRPMSVRGMHVAGLGVSWTWDTETMHVELRGGKMRVRLGPVFAPGTPLEVKSSSETMANPNSGSPSQARPSGEPGLPLHTLTDEARGGAR